MDSLLGAVVYAAPFFAKVAAVWALAIYRPRRHPAILALFAFTAVSEMAVELVPSIWSRGGVVAENTLSCIGIVFVAVYAIRHAPHRRLTLFQMAAVGASALVAGRILGIVFPPDTARRMLVGIHFSAGSMAGVAVSSHRLEPMDDDVLRWLFVTRIVRAAQPAMLDIGRAWYDAANGVATVAWVIAAYWVVYHCVSDSGEPETLPAPLPAPPPLGLPSA